MIGGVVVELVLPELTLVLLVGPSASGKSTFAKRHFLATEVLSSDTFRAWIADDEADQSTTPAAFQLLHLVAAKRLACGRRVVIDATNLDSRARQPLFELARQYYYQVVAFVFAMPVEICLAHNAGRTARLVPEAVILNHCEQLPKAVAALEGEGCHAVHSFSSPAEASSVAVIRGKMPADHRGDSGPFDIIGDVHGCFDELLALLYKLGYDIGNGGDGRAFGIARHPQGRRAIFLGDLVDRGPQAPACLRLAMNMVRQGHALMVLGNHEDKLDRHLRGRKVSMNHGFTATLRQLEVETGDFKADCCQFIASLPSHLVLDGGGLVAVHAGLKEGMHLRDTGAVRAYAIYGEVTGDVDQYGLPVRYNWAKDYRGKARVVYGHTPVAEPEWQNGAICIDTGCVYGGKLSALRYPELELVAVAAAKEYYAAIRPIRVGKSSG